MKFQMNFQMSQKWKDRFKINRGLIPAKIVYFVYGLGTWMVSPYLSLQMFNIGMNYNEIGIITGAVQAISFVATPITGFIGDRIGHKIVLMVMLIALAISGTCLDYTPRFREKSRTPTLQLSKADNSSKFDYVVLSISWPPACEGVNDTLATCQDSAPVTDPNFWNNITEYLDCSEKGPVESNWTLDTNFDFDYVNVTEMAGNGTFCTAGSSSNISEDIFSCSILNHPDVQSCTSIQGSQAKSFWVYLAIRTVFQIALNSVYGLLDGAVMKVADQHGGEYSSILFWQLLAATIGPYLAGVLIPESSDPLVETDFSIAYYLMDGALAIVFLVSFTLDVVMEKSEEKMSSALKNLFGNPAIITFLLINLFMGIGWGAADAYLAIYLNEELGATYALIGIGSSIALGSGIPILPFSKYIIRYFESLNILFASCIVTGARLILYAFITWSPPYHFLILSSFEILCLTLQWIACVHYIEKNCPITLVGTAIATVGATQNVLGRAVGNVVAGQLVTNAGLTIPGMFNAVGIATCIAGITFYIFYLVFCKKYEKKLSDAKKEYQDKNPPSVLDQAKTDNQMKRTKSDMEFELTLRNAAGFSRL